MAHHDAPRFRDRLVRPDAAGALRRRSTTRTNRRAFQRTLVDLPIMRNVVADLAVESEAMMWMAMRLAAALDRADSDGARGFALPHLHADGEVLGLQARAAFVAEALECHGGNGFIADHLMERLYREAPLNGIWEGTGNVICLDVMRAMQREPETIAAFFDEVAQGARRRSPARRLHDRGRTPAHRAQRVRARRPARRRDDGVRAAGEPSAATFDVGRGGCVLRDAARWRLGSRLRHPAERIGYPSDCRPFPHPGGLTPRLRGTSK